MSWQVVKDSAGKVVKHGYCSFGTDEIPAGGSVETYDSPQEVLVDSLKTKIKNDKKAEFDARKSAVAKLKVLGLTDAELTALFG